MYIHKLEGTNIAVTISASSPSLESEIDSLGNIYRYVDMWGRYTAHAAAVRQDSLDAPGLYPPCFSFPHTG